MIVSKNFYSVIEELNSLTCEEIVKLFKDNNIVGKVHDSECCPVSNYIKQACNATVVSVYDIILCIAGEIVWDTVKSSASLLEFIHKFDEGNYPELEMEYV